MNTRAAFTIICLLLSQLLFAQAKTDTISFRKRWLGTHGYMYEGRKINSIHGLSTIIRDDPAAFHYIRRARRVQWIERSLILADLVFIDLYNPHTVSRHSDNFDPDLPVFTTIAILAIDIPISHFELVNVKKAIREYNSDIQKTSYIERQPQLYITTTGTGLGIGLKF